MGYGTKMPVGLHAIPTDNTQLCTHSHSLITSRFCCYPYISCTGFATLGEPENNKRLTDNQNFTLSHTSNHSSMQKLYVHVRTLLNICL